jgi:quercetin dioxygenase-like cupin family protein
MDNGNSIITEKISAGRERRIANLENLMVVVFDFNDGPMNEPDPFHSHPHEQITYVAMGELLFFKGSDEYHLSEGDLMIIPPEIPHCIKTLSRSVRLVDSFTPLRKDFLRINK